MTEPMPRQTKTDPHLAKLDELAARVGAIRFGPEAISSRLARHEAWIRKLAAKAGVALDE